MTSAEFPAFLSRAWADHAQDPEGVASRLDHGMRLLSTAAEIPQLCGLLVHVLGEHLGRWDEGLNLLAKVQGLPFCDAAAESGRAVTRSQEALRVCKGDRTGLETLEASTKARVLAVASAALVGQKRVSEATKLFEEAESLLTYGPTKDDPAARAMAVTSNNLACELEERAAHAPLAPEGRALLVRAARAARKYWEIAGTWVETERAEYRLSRSLLAAGDASEALAHADACLAVCRSQQAGLFEHFFAHEARARALHALGRAADAKGAREEASQSLAMIRDSVSYLTDQLTELDQALAKG